MKCKSILCHGGGNRFLCKIIILHHKCESEMKHVLHSKLKMPWLAYFFNSCMNSQAAKGGVRDLWISFAHLIRVIIHFFIFMPAFPQWRVRGAAALGGLEIPDGRVITRSKIIFTKRAANELISTLRVINNDTVFLSRFQLTRTFDKTQHVKRSIDKLCLKKKRWNYTFWNKKDN